MSDAAQVTEKKQDSMAKLYAKGLALNLISGGLLFVFAFFLELELYVYIAIGMQWGVFLLHGLPFNSEKLYDLSGSATHFAVVAASLVAKTQVRTPRQILISMFSVIWMTRLGSFLYLRISKDGKDERFDDIKRCKLAFAGMWTVQAAWVSLIQAPVLIINDRVDKAPILYSDYIALVLWILGFCIEAKADNEKFVFRSKPENRGTYIKTGIWSLSRHPNYFGEILMWLSIAFSVCFTQGYNKQIDAASVHFAWISPAFTIFLLCFVSGIPLVEKAGDEKWGHLEEYQHHKKGTSCLFLWFPAKPFLPNKVEQASLVQNEEDGKTVIPEIVN